MRRIARPNGGVGAIAGTKEVAPAIHADRLRDRAVDDDKR
jgi:hypothetical protein